MKRLGVLIVVVAAVVALSVSGLGSSVTDAGEIESFLRDRGWVGPVVFVAVMWTLQPLGVPGVAFMVPAALVWPAPAAVALSWVGNMGASFLAFAFARWVARDWAQARLPDRVRLWDHRLATGGVREVAVLRIFTGQLTPADWLLGISSVRLTPFLVGTGIGIVPAIVVIVLAGGSIGSWLFESPARWGTAVALAVAGVTISRSRGRRRAAAAAR